MISCFRYAVPAEGLPRHWHSTKMDVEIRAAVLNITPANGGIFLVSMETTIAYSSSTVRQLSSLETDMIWSLKYISYRRM